MEMEEKEEEKEGKGEVMREGGWRRTKEARGRSVGTDCMMGGRESEERREEGASCATEHLPI